MHLIEILQKHKAILSVPLPAGVGSSYSEYHAHLSFEDGKIKALVFSDEGNQWEFDYEGMDVTWMETISKFVGELQAAKAVPEYTLELPTK
jgi:hypothetical protein